MKKYIWKLHSWVGLVAGLALLLIGVTGSVLVFHEELTRLVARDIVVYEPSEGESRLTITDLLGKTRADHPDYWVAGWLFRKEGNERDIAYLKKKGTDDWYKLRVDPFTGESKTPPLSYRDTLQGWFVDLHYTFFAGHWGLAITAVFALVFIFLSVSGIWLHRVFVRNLFRLRWKASARILFSDLHKLVGVLSIPFNLLLGFTGAYWNIAHIVSEVQEGADHEHEPKTAIVPHVPIEDTIVESQKKWREFELNYIYMASQEEPNIVLYGRIPTWSPVQSPYGSWISFDARTGEESGAFDLRNAGIWANTVDAFEPLHFGDFGGWVSKFIWCLAGLAPGILAVSGFLIRNNRNRSKSSKNSKFRRLRS